MKRFFTIPLTKVIEEFQFERLYESSDLDQILIGSADLNRPGLQIVGFYDYFDNQRLQIVGKVEQTYLEQFPGEKRYQMLERLFSKKIPALIITRAMQAVPEMLELAEEYDVTLLRTEEPTSSLMSAPDQLPKRADCAADDAPRRFGRGIWRRDPDPGGERRWQK